MNNTIKRGMILILACAMLLGAVGCSRLKSLTEDAETTLGTICTLTTESEKAWDAAFQTTEEAYQPVEPSHEQTHWQIEPPPEDVFEASGTPDPDRFNGGMAMTPEEIAQITGSEEYQDAVRQETLYSMLTMNRETESSGSQFYLSDTVKTIPTYDADEWLWLCERAVETHYFYDGGAPEYETIEIYNYAETKTNFIVFVGADGHVEMVCMFQDPYLAVEFDYVGSDVELYHYMQQVSTRITADDISD